MTAAGAGRDATRSLQSGEAADEREHILAEPLKDVEDILREVTAENGKWVMAHLKDDPSCDARLKQFDEWPGAMSCSRLRLVYVLSQSPLDFVANSRESSNLNGTLYVYWNHMFPT